MARFNVNAPDGSIIAVDAPDGATEQDAIAFAAATYKQGVTGIPTEPGANLTPTAVPERSMFERAMGNVETIPAMVGGAVGGLVTPIAQLGHEMLGGQAFTPQGKAAAAQFGQQVAGQFYQPRTPEAQRNIQAIGEMVPPFAGLRFGGPVNALAPATRAIGDVARAEGQYGAGQIGAMQNAIAAAVQRKAAPSMVGMGAAETAAATLRQERAQRMNIPLTKGEQVPELGLQQFESDVVKQNPELARPLIEMKAKQRQAIVNEFERMAEQTGAELADPENVRQIGIVVDKALVNEYTKKFDAYKAKYDLADAAGETLQEVPYKNILDYINSKTPTMRQKLDPILDSVAESLNINDPTGKGTIPIRALEDVYQQIGKVKGSPSAKDLKDLIDQSTEGAGGDLYRAARQARRQLANEFENNYRVAKLIGTKGSYADRAVALDDVFSHIVLDGSLEEMRTVTTLLKKAGPEGRQAYAELQGQTVQHLKDQLTKNASGQLSFAKLKTAIDALDREGKLDYMFGKTGRDQLMDLKATVQDALVKDPRAVNWSNTGNVVLRGLEGLSALRVPLAGKAAEIAKNMALKKKIGESVNYNALAPNSPNVNALTEPTYRVEIRGTSTSGKK